MKKLIFDIEITGHHSEYIRHLIDYLHEFHDNHIYFFVVHPNFHKRFPDISSKAARTKNITIILSTQKEFTDSQKSNLIKKSFFNYRLMHKYAKYYNTEEVLLLYFNIFQLAFIFYRPSFSVRGILFLQFLRMETNTLKEKLKYYRKYFITKLYSINPCIRSVYVLNDCKTTFFLNDRFNTKIFNILPDPIPILKPLSGFNIYANYNIDLSNKIFLHIGSLGERKGTFEVIESSLHIPLELQNKITILLVGKIKNELENRYLHKKIKEFRERSSVNIIWDDQFVSNELMKSLFDQCYAVLMPYKTSETSSGILGHAAAANKNVIATGKGLLQELITENELGLLINNVSSTLLAEKIVELLLLKNPSNRKNKVFLEEHTPAIFAKRLLFQ